MSLQEFKSCGMKSQGARGRPFRHRSQIIVIDGTFIEYCGSIAGGLESKRQIEVAIGKGKRFRIHTANLLPCSCADYQWRCIDDVTVSETAHRRPTIEPRYVRNAQTKKLADLLADQKREPGRKPFTEARRLPVSLFYRIAACPDRWVAFQKMYGAKDWIDSRDEIICFEEKEIFN